MSLLADRTSQSSEPELTALLSTLLLVLFLQMPSISGRDIDCVSTSFFLDLSNQSKVFKEYKERGYL